MFHEFSFGGWGSLPLFVGISIPRQSKLSESKQLWDWPGLVMEPPSKKAQIPFLRAPLCDQCLMIQKETGGFTQNDADVCWEKNATNIYIHIYLYIYILQYRGSCFSTHWHVISLPQASCGGVRIMTCKAKMSSSVKAPKLALWRHSGTSMVLWVEITSASNQPPLLTEYAYDDLWWFMWTRNGLHLFC